MCVVHPTEDKILLGRQKTWPKGMYSALAGFIEAGESMEEAVRREVKEEAGIVIGNVAYHSSQPWVSEHVGCVCLCVYVVISGQAIVFFFFSCLHVSTKQRAYFSNSHTLFPTSSPFLIPL